MEGNSDKTNSNEMSRRKNDKTSSSELSEKRSDVTQRSVSLDDDVDSTQDSISPVNSESDKQREEFGEQLSGFEDDEWKEAAPAFNPEFINVKADASKPTVFQASHLVVEKVASKSPHRHRRRRRGDIKPTSVPGKFPHFSSNSSVTTLVPPKADVSSPFEVEDKATLIGRLLSDVVRLYLQGKQEQDVQVELSLIQKDSASVSTSYSSPLAGSRVLDRFMGSPSNSSSSAELNPPKAIVPAAKSVSTIMTALEGIDESELPYMVPELKKLIKALKASNLSREDFNEISEQLASNGDVEQPRENTSPATITTAQSSNSESQGESTSLKIPNEKRDKATNRNLAALRNALSDQIVKKVMLEDHPAPVIISLQRPHNYPRQVERQSVASKLRRINSYPPQIVHQESGEQNVDAPIESTTAKAKIFAVTAHARRVMPESSHRQDGQIENKSRAQASVSSHENRVSFPTENLRTQIDDATGGQVEPKNADASSLVQTTSIGSTTTTPLPPVPAQQRQPQQWQNTGYQPNYQSNYYNYQQQPVYYPQYGAYYYPQQLQQQQYSSGQQQYYYQTTPRSQPARMVPEPVQSTPASVLTTRRKEKQEIFSLLHHPFGHGALLTLMQPNQIFGRK